MDRWPALVGASRVSVNKWLSNFERRRLLKRRKGGIELLAGLLANAAGSALFRAPPMPQPA